MNENYIYQDGGRDKIISITLTEKEKSTEEKVEVKPKDVDKAEEVKEEEKVEIPPEWVTSLRLVNYFLI